jgi:hypothetical protein
MESFWFFLGFGAQVSHMVKMAGWGHFNSFACEAEHADGRHGGA